MKIAAKIKKHFRDKTFRKVVLVFLLIKISIIVIGIAAYVLIPKELTHRQMVTENPFLNPWAQYDAQAYLDIAKNGYNIQFMDGVGNYAWYPLYPLFIKIFSFVGYELAAFMVANIFSFLAVMALYFLVKDEISKSAAYRTVLYLSLFPTAYFLTAMYAESVFLFLSITTFYYLKKRNWLMVGIFGALASLSRIQGAFLLLPALWVVLHDRKRDVRTISILLIPIGFSILLLYHYVLAGNPLMQFYTQHMFGREITFPWVGIINSFISITKESTVTMVFYHFFNIFIVFFTIFLLIKSFKCLKREYFIYFLSIFLVSISSSMLMAVSRHALVTFPAFLVLGKLSENKKNERYIKILYIFFAILLVLFTIRHVNEWFTIMI
jgi:Gpi18-like mannosyltransferase